MRVAYYYNQGVRLPADDPNNNPYGTLLSEALERQGATVEYTVDFDEDYLQRNAGRVDVLHFNWPHYIYFDDDEQVMAAEMRGYVRRLELARSLGYKLVWTAHNLYPHNRVHWQLDQECRLALCRLATGVIAHCRVAADALQQTFGPIENLFVIPHGTFLNVYTIPFSKEQARARLGIPAHAFVYATLGLIRPYKGIENMMDSFRRVAAADAWLVISGGSKDEAYLSAIRAYAAEHPRIVLRMGCPKPTNDDFLSALQAADVIAQPFLATTTSGSLMLALSSALPVIAPALGCLPDLVTPAAGILYPPAAAGALDDALLAIRSYDMVDASRAALSLASERRYNWDVIARQTIEVYQA